MIVRGGRLYAFGHAYPCIIGKCGFSVDKREGDSCTPIGEFLLRECWYRADRLNRPQTQLPLRIIGPEDGWCDDPADANYNRHVRLPYPARHEKLWREDHLYDLVVPLGYNDDPVVPGKGSAIFMHVAPLEGGTEGCLALEQADLLALLAHASQKTAIRIEKAGV